MKERRRRFSDWELYTSRPVTLGYKPPGATRGFIYHVPVKDCENQVEYED